MCSARRPPLSVALAVAVALVAAAAGCLGARPRPAPVAGPAPAPPRAEASRLGAVLARAGCRDCHGAGGEASDTQLVFPPPGADPETRARAAAGLWALVDAGAPESSRLLRKPTKRMLHEGGQRIAPGSEDERALLAWLSAAARAGGPERAAVDEILSPPPPALAWPARFDGAAAGLRRLTRDELVATFQALTGAAPAREDLPEDPRAGHGMLVTAGVPLLGGEVLALKLVLRTFAAGVAPDVLASAGCKSRGASQAVCLRGWADRFAARALRRRPDVDERQRLHDLVASADGTPDRDRGAVAAVLAALFQSPSFLYRSERGQPVPGTALRALTADELAARLSYLATMGPPDAPLAAAARAGRLADGGERVRHFDRLVATAPGRRAQAAFVLEWLGATETRLGFKSFRYLDKLPADFSGAVRESAETAIRRVLEGETPTLRALLTTTDFLSDPVIQALTAANEARKTGDTEQTGRMGLLMHPQVLAAHTKENGSSPFQIGVFVREALLCEPVPAPPPDAAAAARTDTPPGLGTRERFEHRTSAGRACTGCHATFAPLGYAFLPFDPVGRWTIEDPAGTAWNLGGEVATFSGVPLSFSSPAELVGQLAAHPQVQGCFAQAALQWTFGRPPLPTEEPLLQDLAAVARDTQGHVAGLFRALVSSPAFASAAVSR